MKKYIPLTILILILITSFVSYWYYYVWNNNDNNSEVITNEYNPDDINSPDWIEKADEKLDTLKKKISLKWLLAKWDLYYENMEYTTALTQFLQIYKEIPNDNEINLKIWDIYYNINKYDKAYQYYSNIKNYPNLDKTKAVLSLINSRYEWSGSLESLNSEIDSIWLSKQDNFYYKNSLICIIDFSKCRANFQDGFNKLETTGSWATIEKSEKLENINIAFENYKNFKIDDLSYKAALVTWEFYKNWSYFIALETSKKILKENENYKPILKIAAKSSYELWKYKEAKEFLIEYNKLESEDPEISYFLARVYEKLNDKLLSTIHYNKAIKIWYSDINDIRRRLIFIYFELNNNEKMLSTFKDLINSKDKNININDYNLAIFYHILNDDLETALKYSDAAKLKYPKSELFYWYNSWILLQKEEISEYQLKIVWNNINKALEINDKSPMIIMVKWIFEFRKELYEDAFVSFKKAISLDKNNEYSETTKLWLDKIPKKSND